MWEVCYEGVGGVEECVERDGVECAEEDDDGDGGESSVADVGHEDTDGWRRVVSRKYVTLLSISSYTFCNTSGIHVVAAFLHLYITTIPESRE